MIDTSALREKVLDLAIRGKLVPQDPNDEPASVILERIRAEKEQMVKDGKLKAKDIKNDTIIFKGEDNLHYEKFSDGTVKCIEDEIPFDVPDGWAWCRLESIASTITDYVANGSFASLKANTTTYKEKNYALFVRTVDFANDFKKDLVYIDKTTYDFLEKSKLYGNELMLSNIGASIGKVFKIPMFDIPMSLAPNSIILRFFDGIFTDFFEYMFKSFVGQDYLQMLSGGSAMPKFNKTDLRAMIVPIAPSNEQIKIVEKINSIFDLIEKIDNSHIDISGLIQSAKSKILDLAIQGKLVPQNQDDEPASVLLERIKAEKEELIKQGEIKRDKKESTIFKGDDNSYYEKIGDNIICIDDEVPFEIPENWRWERLGNISTIARGGSPRPINEYLTNQENGINWIKIGDTEQGGKYIYSTKEKIIPDGVSKSRYVKSGDFLLTNSMSYGRPYILKTDGCIHDGWLVIGDIENIFYQDFLYYALSSNEMYRAFSNLAAGSTVKNLKSDSVKSILFPIPPYNEQIQISNYIEKFYSLIGIIEKSLS